jgi:hypothetical protein
VLEAEEAEEAKEAKEQPFVLARSALAGSISFGASINPWSLDQLPPAHFWAFSFAVIW